jgi:hypothetical protein
MKDICPSRDDAQPHLYHNGICVLCMSDDSPSHEPIRRSSAPVNSHRVLLKWAEGAKNRQREQDSF